MDTTVILDVLSILIAFVFVGFLAYGLRLCVESGRASDGSREGLGASVAGSDRYRHTAALLAERNQSR